MENNPIIAVVPLSFQWPVLDPFIFCAHHNDHYPRGNGEMGPPEAMLEGRRIGEDFELKDGWRMYHGETIPGFPSHPHRGFETVTVVLQGFVDHSDSHKQAGRYGNGDVQWMTAGSGLQHSEMFPLINEDADNPLELFQVWLNLPREKKMAAPHFKMLWAEEIPEVTVKDEKGLKTKINLIAGRIGDVQAPAPAPDSWAANPENEVAIWTIKMEPGAVWELPTASEEVFRVIFFYRGSSILVNDTVVNEYTAVQLKADSSVKITAGETDCFIFLLQGMPINEPVYQYGPFVMNTKAEITKAFVDFDQTQFGGWPWERRDNVFPKDAGRFAEHIDGRKEIK